MSHLQTLAALINLKKYLEAPFSDRRIHKSKPNFAAFQQMVPNYGIPYPSSCQHLRILVVTRTGK